jgi:hypothetical protein
VKRLHHNNIYLAKSFYFKNPFQRNIIKNPCGDNGFSYWCLDTPFNREFMGGNLMEFFLKNNIHRQDTVQYNAWKIESDHHGSEELIIDNKVVKNFATSYREATKFQMIDLETEGLTRQILDKMKLKIRIFENYAARNDCGSRYCLIVRLLNHKFEQIDEFKFEDTIAQWQSGNWHEVSHVFEIDSNDLRYIFYYHHGSDTQFWAGFYGMKITNSTVQFLI